MSNPALEAALKYASWGWHVLPVVSGGKEAIIKDWVNKATTDPEIIKIWWGAHPDRNIAVLAGAKSGLIVFDIDPRNGGDDSWDAWRNAHGNGECGECATQLTQGGGHHYLARYDQSVPSCKLAPGIDLLSDGRYFLVYPSVVSGRPYHWEGSSDPADGVAPMTIPPEWVAAIRGIRSTKPHMAAMSSEGSTFPAGQRNNCITAIGGSLRGIGLQEDAIYAALEVVNNTRCVPPLSGEDVRRISRSVTRYEPNGDVAIDSMLGNAAADALLGIASRSDYYLTQATSLMAQPAPIPWLVKGWLPASSTTMIFGASGIGKTFLAVDIACHIARGMPWRGNKTRHGVVVYLAGEGNYGIRTRLASWCKHHNVTGLDNLYVSNRAIDLDSPRICNQILDAIHDAVGDSAVEAVIVDTLNRHMAGDENSARDVRALLDSCAMVSGATGASTILVHHTGHVVNGASSRERGSSAIRASLDASILVSHVKGESGTVSIACAKMKDAREPEPVYGELIPIELGWVDEDGEPVGGGCVLGECAALTIEGRADSKHSEHKQMLCNAWMHTKREMRDGKPYVSSSGFKDYLVEKLGMTIGTAGKYVQPGAQGKPICALLAGGVIAVHPHGWTIEDKVLASSLIMQNE